MNFEKIQPPLKETEKPEEAAESAEMPQKKNPAEPIIKVEHGQQVVLTPEKPYFEKTNVNGTEIETYWDDGFHSYVIYFPQIEFGDTAFEKGVSDELLIISRKPEIAKQAFDYAAKSAQTEKDVYEIYKKVDKFSRTLPHGL